MKIKKNDKVLVIAGKNRGKTGKVTDVFPRNSTVIVGGVNLQKRHVKPKKKREKGQVVEFEAPVDISNLKVICPSCNKPTRIGYKTEGSEKYRICKKCNAPSKI
jgi:large subunit ribosomal protein L24